MEEKDAYEILEKIQRGTSTEEELLLFDQWYFQYHHQHVRQYSEVELLAIQEEMRRKLPVPAEQGISGNELIGKPLLYRWPFLAVAASILILSGFAYYLFYLSHQKTEVIISAEKYSNDVAPGGNKAYLTLANGQRISLSDAKNGELAQESGVKITKMANGELSYQITEKGQNSGNKDDSYNTIETPKGGQYRINLPDGTKVWLNAASTLKFPSSFARLVNRRVELLGGEAYFEVAKDPTHPFIVASNGQELKVLGTHFNINAYPEESTVKTTLVEGKLQLTNADSSNKFILQPGQQAALAKNGFHIYEVDVAAAIAWKNNKFVFDNEGIEEVMRKIERWYNVSVEFEGERPTDKFTGTVSRFDQLSSVLNLLELTGNVHFKIEGRRVLVRK
ncbi:FecR family protein [Pedobacter polysacchareus]|uniref:FecR family protein n=1 Tax=Pedobacter polysacchareus TaxID=2861973 RepID=UPI001C98F62C|nr:FecR family protein [Pedobacter polysacchareus]